MAKKLCIGNLSYDMTDNDLQELFETYGTVRSARIVLNRDAPPRSQGFGFVEMDDAEEARAAIDALDGRPVYGRALTVSEARPREHCFWRAPSEFAHDFFG